MNIGMLRMLGELVSIALIIVTPNASVLSKSFHYKENPSLNYNSRMQTEVTEFDTKYYYNSNVTTGTSITYVEGVDGIIKVDDEGNQIGLVQELVNEEMLIGTGATASYEGRLTGYGPDCLGCSTEGYVACRTRDRSNFSLIHDGITYEDVYFGELRILAADHRLFPCGTILELSNTRFGTFSGIVLDTGYEMRKYYDEEKVLIDLAYTSGSDENVRLTTKNDVMFTVKRWGW